MSSLVWRKMLFWLENLSRVEVWEQGEMERELHYDDMDSIVADMENMGIVI